MKFFEHLAARLHHVRHPNPAPAYRPPPAGHYPVLLHRHHGEQLLFSLPQRSTRSVGTQTEATDFAPVPTIRITPPSAAPVSDSRPTISQIEARRQARARFEDDIRIAHTCFSRKVRFTEVCEDGRTLGYLMAAAEFADSPNGPKPVLFVTGNSRRSHATPEVSSGALITTLRAEDHPAGHLRAAQNFRRGQIAPGHRMSSTLPGYPVPNLELDAGAMSPSEAASFVFDTGRERDHAQSVELFLPAPGTRAHLSTLERVLGAGDRYSAIAYSHR